MKYRLWLCFVLLHALALALEVQWFIVMYSGIGSKGIYVYKFNAATDKAIWVSSGLAR